MVELVDTTVLEAVAMRCEGSSPSLGTIKKLKGILILKRCYFVYNTSYIQ